MKRPEIFTFDDWQPHIRAAAVSVTKSVCLFIYDRFRCYYYTKIAKTQWFQIRTTYGPAKPSDPQKCRYGTKDSKKPDVCKSELLLLRKTFQPI